MIRCTIKINNINSVKFCHLDSYCACSHAIYIIAIYNINIIYDILTVIVSST